MKVLSLAYLALTMSLSSLSFAQASDAGALKYDIELSYDSASKDLTIGYEYFASSRCALFTQNLVVNTADQGADAGLISFDVETADICLMALGMRSGRVTIENFTGAAHALEIEGSNYGFVRLNDKGQAELVQELPVALEEDLYSQSVKLGYDAKSKDLTISYSKFDTMRCGLETLNLVVTDSTPSLVGSLELGLISFDTARPEGVMCLAVIGQVSGEVVIKNFAGNPHALIINGTNFGFIRLSADGSKAELAETL